MQLYEPFLKPVLSNEVAGELSGKANEGVKPNVPTFTMEDSAEETSSHAELVESSAAQTKLAMEEAKEESKNKFDEAQATSKAMVSFRETVCGVTIIQL